MAKTINRAILPAGLSGALGQYASASLNRCRARQSVVGRLIELAAVVPGAVPPVRYRTGAPGRSHSTSARHRPGRVCRPCTTRCGPTGAQQPSRSRHRRPRPAGRGRDRLRPSDRTDPRRQPRAAGLAPRQPPRRIVVRGVRGSRPTALPRPPDRLSPEPTARHGLVPAGRRERGRPRLPAKPPYLNRAGHQQKG